MSNQAKKIKKSNRLFGAQGCPSCVNIPLRGKSFSTAVLAAYMSCKGSPSLLGVKRGCAAHGAAQIMSILLNRIALGTGRGTALCALTNGKHLHRYTALISPFSQRHHFAPLRKKAAIQTTTTHQQHNNNKASALRLDALQNDASGKLQHIYTGCLHRVNVDKSRCLHGVDPSGQQ